MTTIARQLTLLGAACATSVCLAQSPAAAPPETQADTAKIDFMTLDKDESGDLSKEEVQVIAELRTAFDQLDADKNRMVSAAEFARWNRAGKTKGKSPDPATAPRGSAGTQHMPDAD